MRKKEKYYSLFLFSLTLFLLFAGRLEARLDGDCALHLIKAGTGSSGGGQDTVTVTMGDVLKLDIYIVNRSRERVTGYEAYVTLDEKYFSFVSQGTRMYKDQIMQEPFIKGNYVGGSITALGNVTHDRYLEIVGQGDLDQPGIQLDYKEYTQGPGYVNRASGVVAQFWIVALAPGENIKIGFDNIQSYGRVTHYFIHNESEEYDFNYKKGITINVRGFEIAPTIHDVFFSPGEADSSIVLDDYVNDPTTPDSLMRWTVLGQDSVRADINPNTRRVRITALEGFSGRRALVFKATNSANYVALDTINVTVNSAPSFILSMPESLTVYEDSTMALLRVSDYVIDPPYTQQAPNITYSVTAGQNIQASIDSETDSLIIRGDQDYWGESHVWIYAADPYNLVDSIRVVVNVLSQSDPPSIVNFPDSIRFERTGSYFLSLDDYVFDPDDITFTWSYEQPDNIFLGMNAENQATFFSTGTFVGSEMVTFTVRDPSGLQDTDSLLVRIAPRGGTPVISKFPKIGFGVGGSDSSLFLDEYVTDLNDPDSVLTWVITGENYVDEITVNPENRRVTFRDLGQGPGWDRITCTVYDPDGNHASGQMLVFIASADGTPIVGGIPDTTIVIGSSIAWIDLDNYYYDFDNTDAEMTWTASITGNPVCTVEIDTLTHFVQINAAEGAGGLARIVFSVSDPYEKTADDVANVVVIGNEADPILSFPFKYGFARNTTLRINLDEYVVDPTFPDSVITWYYSGQNNVTISIDESDPGASRPLTFRALANWTGWERIIMNATNPYGLTASDSILVFVVPQTGEPVAGGFPNIILPSGTVQTIDLDNYYYDINNTDSQMKWSVTGDNHVVISIDTLSHVATIGTRTRLWEGDETVLFTVTDPAGLSGSASMLITVTDALPPDALEVSFVRNPMQNDFMNFYVKAKDSLLVAPALYVKTGADSTWVSLRLIATDFYMGKYVLDLEASRGLSATATVITYGTTAIGKATSDTTTFDYGVIGRYGGKIAGAGGDYTLTVPPGALKNDVVFVVTVKYAEPLMAKANGKNELIPAGLSLSIEPVQTEFDRPAELVFFAEKMDEKTGVYHLSMEEERWEYCDTQIESMGFTANILSAGNYALLKDISAPEVTNIRVKWDNNPEAICYISDHGSGVDTQSIVVTANGRSYQGQYNMQNSVYSITLSDETDIPDTWTVVVHDRAGNITVRELKLADTDLPVRFQLYSNIPNPFNPSTVISFSITGPSGRYIMVNMEVYNVMGQRVRGLLLEELLPGSYQVVFDAKNDNGQKLAAGVYLYCLKVDGKLKTRKMILLK